MVWSECSRFANSKLLSFMYVSELVRNLPVCVLVKLYLLYSIYFHCFCWFAIAVIDSEPRILANSEFSFTPGIRWQQVSCLSSTVTRIWCRSNKFSSVLKPHRQAAYMTIHSDFRGLKPVWGHLWIFHILACFLIDILALIFSMIIQKIVQGILHLRVRSWMETNFGIW